MTGDICIYRNRTSIFSIICKIVYFKISVCVNQKRKKNVACVLVCPIGLMACGFVAINRGDTTWNLQCSIYAIDLENTHNRELLVAFILYILEIMKWVKAAELSLVVGSTIII